MIRSIQKSIHAPLTFLVLVVQLVLPLTITVHFTVIPHVYDPLQGGLVETSGYSAAARSSHAGVGAHDCGDRESNAGCVMCPVAQSAAGRGPALSSDDSSNLPPAVLSLSPVSVDGCQSRGRQVLGDAPKQSPPVA